LKLGPLVGYDGCQVFSPRLGQGLNRLQLLNRTGRAEKLCAPANVREVELKRLDYLGHGLPSIVQSFSCCYPKLISGNHIRCDLGLGTVQRDVGGPPLCESSMHGDIAEAEVSQVPEEAGRGIATAAKIAKE
jgi:hypothetical protein